VLAGAGAAVALAGVGQRVERRDLLTHEISALTVNAGAGDVTVRTGGQPGTVEVTRKGRSSASLAALGPSDWQGSTLTLDCGDVCTLDYEIRVPAGVNVTAETGSGDIELDGALGAVDVRAGSGDVGANVAARTMATRTGSGDIDLQLGNAPSQLTANSGSGDVAIQVPDGQSYVLNTHTGSGDIDIAIPQTNGADHSVQVQTGSGDISIRGG
jgi:DUF4097 and DUF4098 domain-containing protein YvlB